MLGNVQDVFIQNIYKLYIGNIILVVAHHRPAPNVERLFPRLLRGAYMMMSVTS